jgi:Protein of unknown function (DUF2934)
MRGAQPDERAVKVDVATSLPECKVADLQSCTINSDCASDNCVTFFVDADGDGYGTPTEAQICTELGAQLVSRGRQDGFDLEDWVAAEQELAAGKAL